MDQPVTGCARARTSVGRPRWTSPSMPSTACWTWDTRSPSAPPSPAWVGLVAASNLILRHGRRRTCFALRRHLGGSYLDPPRFFLNHQRFMRSRQVERQGKPTRTSDRPPSTRNSALAGWRSPCACATQRCRILNHAASDWPGRRNPRVRQHWIAAGYIPIASLTRACDNGRSRRRTPAASQRAFAIAAAVGPCPASPVPKNGRPGRSAM